MLTALLMLLIFQDPESNFIKAQLALPQNTPITAGAPSFSGDPIDMYVSVGLNADALADLSREIEDWNRQSSPHIRIVRSRQTAAIILAWYEFPEQSQLTPVEQQRPKLQDRISSAMYNCGMPLGADPAEVRRACDRQAAINATRPPRMIETMPVRGYIFSQSDGELIVFHRHVGRIETGQAGASAQIANALFQLLKTTWGR